MDGAEGERKTMPRISGEFLIGDNHGISFEAYRYSQGYADAWAGAYSAGPFGASVATGLSLDFDLDVARLGYRYWFGSGNTVVGVGAGIGYYRVSLETHAFASGAAGLEGLGFVGYNGYYSRHDARTIRRRLGGDGRTVYLCHISGAWHLGHPQQGKSRDHYRKEAR